MNVLVTAHKIVSTRNVTERNQPLKRRGIWNDALTSHTMFTRALMQRCACGKAKAHHRAGALFRVSFLRFPRACAFRRRHSGMSRLSSPGRQSSAMRVWPWCLGETVKSVSRRAAGLSPWNPAAASQCHTPGKANLVFRTKVLLEPSLKSRVLEVFFLLLLMSLTILWTLLEEDEDASSRLPLAGPTRSPARLSCCYRDLPLPAFRTTKQKPS